MSGSFADATATPSEVGFLWGIDEAALTERSAATAVATPFTLTLTGLTPSTTYHCCAYATVGGTGDYSAQTAEFRGTTRTFTTAAQEGAYMNCLEMPAVPLTSSTSTRNTSSATYGREQVFTTTNSEQIVVVHEFDDRGSTAGTSNGVWYRNFTMLYDNSKYAALWVAYSMSDLYTPLTTSITRPNDWKSDPAVTNEYSGYYSYSGTTTDSRGYAYDRGHQCANMMRNQCSKNAQLQTFFHSNQMPQISTFNQNKWVELENKELEWYQTCDTMYVVTGPIFDSGYYCTTDKAGTAIPVATRYFKAIIKCDWSGTAPNKVLSQVKGIGFIFTHTSNANAESYTEACTSIDAVEAATGFNLFCNLPDELETAAERNASLSAF